MRPALIIGITAVTLAGCGGFDPATEQAARGSADSDGPVAASVGEYSITLERGSAAHGKRSFTIRNDGAIVHEFVILRSDKGEDALPVEGRKVSEDGAGEVVDEVEDLAPGKTATLTADLAAGAYVIVCNLPKHYSRGMHAAFRVT
jgi:uncharacterized cupredoxin-like copper-binding protein